MSKINWENEKENLISLIERKISFQKIAKIYGIKKGSHIKKMAIKLGIQIINPKTNEFYEYKKPKYTCKYCGKEFENEHKLGGHVTHCKNNPNYEKNLENTENARKHIRHYFKQVECFCKFCGKKVSNYGCLAIHEKACSENPNRIKCQNRKGNGGNANGHTIWNKGKTAKDDVRILKQMETRKKSFEDGKFKIISKPHTEETKQILREKMIEYIKKNGNGTFGQHYSKKGCKYIDFLNVKNDWNLIHAENGGEKQVCGYFLDGYDEKLNIAFEYDEPKHYKDVYNNILTEKDIQRQNIIINELKCKFYRYNEKIDKLYCVN